MMSITNATSMSSVVQRQTLYSAQPSDNNKMAVPVPESCAWNVPSGGADADAAGVAWFGAPEIALNGCANNSDVMPTRQRSNLTKLPHLIHFKI